MPTEAGCGTAADRAWPEAIGACHPLTNRAASEVICHRQGRRITVGQLLAEAAALAGRLPGNGHGHGPDQAPAEAYAINICTDRYRMLLGFVAALLRGHVTLLNADPAPQRLVALADRHPGAYVLADSLEPDDLPMPVLRLGEACGGPSRLTPPPDIPAARIVAIGFTSGSTGAPTAHPKPWGALVAAARAAARRFSLDAMGNGGGDARGDAGADVPATLLATVPPQHMYGFETTIMLPLQAKVGMYSGASFFPSDVLDALAALPPRRVLVTTPLHLRALLAEGRRPAPLEAVISATAPLATPLAEAVEHRWHAPMLEIFGATEAGSIASRRTVREPDWLPYDGVAVRAQGVTVPGLGEVLLADLLEPTGDGRFRLVGRRSDLIKLGGRRASLADLNRQLLDIDGVTDGVFFAPDDIDSNPVARLAACAVAPGRSAEQILAALRGRIEPHFLPRPLLLVPALPRDGLGKLPHRSLAALRLAARSG